MVWVLGLVIFLFDWLVGLVWGFFLLVFVVVGVLNLVGVWGFFFISLSMVAGYQQ